MSTAIQLEAYSPAPQSPSNTNGMSSYDASLLILANYANAILNSNLQQANSAENSVNLSKIAEKVSKATQYETKELNAKLTTLNDEQESQTKWLNTVNELTLGIPKLLGDAGDALGKVIGNKTVGNIIVQVAFAVCLIAITGGIAAPEVAVEETANVAVDAAEEGEEVAIENDPNAIEMNNLAAGPDGAAVENVADADSEETDAADNTARSNSQKMIEKVVNFKDQVISKIGQFVNNEVRVEQTVGWVRAGGQVAQGIAQIGSGVNQYQIGETQAAIAPVQGRVTFEKTLYTNMLQSGQQPKSNMSANAVTILNETDFFAGWRAYLQG